MIERIPAADRKTWLALRSHDVTASVAGALLGVHPFVTPWALYALKAGIITEDAEENEAMQRGRLLEPVAVQLLREQRPDWKISHNTGKSQVYLRDPDIRLGATPDVFVRTKKRENGIVQLKSVEASNFRKLWLTEDGEPDPPLWIYAQAIVEAHMTGADFAMIGALVVSHGIDLHLVDVPLHAGVLDRIKAETALFWKRIAEGDEPPRDYGADGALIAGLYAGQDNGREIDLSGDNRIHELLFERAQRKAVLAAEAEALERIDYEIIDKIGDHERAYVPGWRISRQIVRRKAHWVDASEFRALRISPAN